MDKAMNRGESTGSLLNLDFFSGDSVKLSDYNDNTSTTKKKRGRPKTKTISDGSTYVVSEDAEPLPLYQSNEPYLDTYGETTGMLKTSVNQIDLMQSQITTDLDQIRNSKTLRKKYDYIAALTSSVSTLVGSKITAIREMNKVITDSHNLEMKRTKEFKIGIDDQDDDKRLADMYNAFVSTPVGINPVSLGPSITDISMYGGQGIVRNEMMQDPNAGFNAYAQNVSPNQNMMRLENNPNVKTVVVFNQDSGQMMFDVIDKVTMQPVPNTEKPDPMFLMEEQGLKLDFDNGLAINNNLGTTYDLVVIGGNNGIMNEY